MGSTAGYTVTLRCVFENALYPGVADALPELCRAGHVLQIVTAKPAVSARRRRTSASTGSFAPCTARSFRRATATRPNSWLRRWCWPAAITIRR